ncbi:MAG: alpha/beta fold hydrolase [Rudaea sp.]
MSSIEEPPRSVVFLPGGVLPAAPQYGALLGALDGKVRPFLKDLEVYAGDEPPKDYALDIEVEAVKRFAESNGLTGFDLVGYSGGGAIGLAVTARYPELVKSLALSEPAVIPSQQWFREESSAQAELNQIMSLPPEQQMLAFIRAHLRPGVQPPPPPSGPAPDWMRKRPAGLQALNNAFNNYDLDVTELQRFRSPVYIAVGGLSIALFERMADRLTGLFPNAKCQIYEGRHHFDPPQRAEPERFAGALLELWSRAPI